MARESLKTQQEVSNCIVYLDQQWEKQSQQTNQVAETIINDINELTKNYQEAMQKSQLAAHADKVHLTQMKWVKQLQDLTSQKQNQADNSQIINALHKFAKNLNKKSMQQLELRDHPIHNDKMIQTTETSLNH